MTEREMFERSFQRPRNYFKLSEEKQWKIDSDLGILDWEGEDLSDEDMTRFNEYFKFVENEYKCFKVLQTINENTSDIEKARIIAKIIDQVN